MIKKISYFLIAVFTLFISINVNAECTTQDLEALDIYAANVKASYDLIDNSVKKSITEDGSSRDFIVPNFSYKISVYNIVDDIYIKITNSIDDNEVIVKKADTTNGTYILTDNDFVNVNTYTIEVYSNNQNCAEKKLKTITLTKPRYNVYYETDYCQKSQEPICQRFVRTKPITYEDFLERISENNETPKTTEAKQSKLQEFLANNGKRLAIVGVLITFVVVLVVIVKHNIDDNKMKKGGWKI